MKIIAVVPMKLNNQRLPQKNIKSFTNGEPLCHYILATLSTISEINEIYVYCSNPKIIDFLPKGVKFLKRKKSLDQDTTKMNEILECFAEEIYADVYVMTHTTAPFISSLSIIKGLNAVINNKYDSAFSAQKMQEFLWKDGIPINYSLDRIPRTQDLEVFFKETSGFYIYDFYTISKLKRRIGNYPFLVEIGEIEGCDIDELEDFQIADAIFNYKLLKNIDKEN